MIDDERSLPAAEGTRSAELVAELRSPESMANPNPATYAEAASLLHGYFGSKLRYSHEGGVEDTNFADALDDVVSALGGLYARDERTAKMTLEMPFGHHPADDHLEAALRAAYNAAQRAEEAGATHHPRSLEVLRVLGELEFTKGKPLSQDDSRPLRTRAADALRHTTRSTEKEPAAQPYLAQVGMEATEVISVLAGIAARHEADASGAPLFKDYLARHIANALELSER